jgi:hypothetical protein
MINSLSYVVLIDDDVFGLVSHLFNKSLMSAWPITVAAPYCHENPPPSVGHFNHPNFLFFCC